MEAGRAGRVRPGGRASTGPGRPTELPRTARTSSCSDLAELLERHDDQPSARYAVEPWCLRETELDLDVLAQSESVFALSNGHIGWRGNLDEGEPHGLPGTYLNGVHELRPLPYAEAGYGYPESGQTVINVTNGKLIRLLVDDEPFDLRYGELHCHERVLDFRAGVLRRDRGVDVPGRPRGARPLHPAGVLHPARRSRRSRYEVEPVDAGATWSCSPSWSPTSRCRAPPATRGSPPRSSRRCGRRRTSRDDTRLRLVHRTRAQRPAGGGRGRPHRRRPRGHRVARPRAIPTWAG